MTEAESLRLRELLEELAEDGCTPLAPARLTLEEGRTVIRVRYRSATGQLCEATAYVPRQGRAGKKT